MGWPHLAAEVPSCAYLKSDNLVTRTGKFGHSQCHSSITCNRKAQNTFHQMGQTCSLIPANHQGPSCTSVNIIGSHQQTIPQLTSPAFLQHTVEQSLLAAATTPIMANSATKTGVRRASMLRGLLSVKVETLLIVALL